MTGRGWGREGIWCLTSTASARLSLICGEEATEDEDTAELMTPATAMATLVSRAICGHTL